MINHFLNMNYKKSKISFKLTSILFFLIITSGCEKRPVEKDDQELSANFIPSKNKKYIYRIETNGKYAGKATQWISGEKDSSGIIVYNLQSLLETPDVTINMDNKVFVLEGKTYNEMVIPEAWNQTLKLFDAMPNIHVVKSEFFGYPAYLTMENLIRENSILSLSGPSLQGQRIEYTNKGEPSSLEQNLILEPGVSSVETVEVAAGSFVCNKFTYSTRSKIININKEGEFLSNGEEHITVWVAHGIGTIKQQSSARLVTVVVLPNGEIKELVTNTTSTKNLLEIK